MGFFRDIWTGRDSERESYQEKLDRVLREIKALPPLTTPELWNRFYELNTERKNIKKERQEELLKQLRKAF